jgi:hypothetical protein
MKSAATATTATATSAAPAAPDAWSTIGALLDEFPSSTGARREEIRTALQQASGTAGAGAAVAISAALAAADEDDRREELIEVHRGAASQLQARTDAEVAHRRAMPARWAALDPTIRALFRVADRAEESGDPQIAGYFRLAAREAIVDDPAGPPARSFERTR